MSLWELIQQTIFKMKLHDPETTTDIVRSLREEICKLSCNPFRHGLYEDTILAKLDVKKQYFQNYIIFYRVQEEVHTVEIVSVLHMRVDRRKGLHVSIIQTDIKTNARQYFLISHEKNSKARCGFLFCNVLFQTFVQFEDSLYNLQ